MAIDVSNIVISAVNKAEAGENLIVRYVESLGLQTIATRSFPTLGQQ